MLPGVVVVGSADVEWLEGGRFLLHRARCEPPDFPDSISIIGRSDGDRASDDGGPLRWSYFDSRGVARVYDVGVVCFGREGNFPQRSKATSSTTTPSSASRSCASAASGKTTWRSPTQPPTGCTKINSGFIFVHDLDRVPPQQLDAPVRRC